jgi:hypothetical protein
MNKPLDHGLLFLDIQDGSSRIPSFCYWASQNPYPFIGGGSIRGIKLIFLASIGALVYRVSHGINRRRCAWRPCAKKLDKGGS